MSLKHKLTTLGAVGALFASLLAPSAAFAAENDDVNPGGPDRAWGTNGTGLYTTIANFEYRPGDLFSSVIFSESSDVKSADGVELSFDTIQRYPTAKDDVKMYGQLIPPEGDAGDEGDGTLTGEYLVSQLRTYYEYGWFEPLPRDDESIFSPVVRWFQDVKKSFEDIVAHASLSLALFGATLYDGAISFLETLEGFVSGINLPVIFGLAPAPSGNDPGWLSKLLTGTLEAFGLTGDMIMVIQGLTMSAIVFMFLVVTIWALRSLKNRGDHIKNSKKWGSRVLIMMLTIPTWVAVTSVWNSVSNLIGDLNAATPGEVNSSYFVDTLDWAVYGNMDLTLMNNTSGSPHNSNSVAAGNTMYGLDPSGQKSTNYEPNATRITQLNANLALLKSTLGGQDSEKQVGAREMLSKFISGDRSNVNDYISGVASLKCLNASAATINGTQVPECTHRDNPNSLARFDLGIGNDTLFQTENATRPYFFSPREDQAEAEQTGGVATRQTIQIGQQTFELTEKSPITARPIRFNDPKTYVYGAIPPENLSKSTAEYANYIYDARTSLQLVNPETGESVGDSNPTDNAGDPETERARAIRTNALQIAIYNRFGGMNEGLALSDQSTAFFLQTKRSGADGINYKGYNTVANETGESKNTGRYGNAFVRYVMPVASESDYTKNIASLNGVWLTSGILAVAVVFILLRSPIFGALFYSIKGFLGSLFSGNIYSFAEGILYYSALRVSFVFASAAIYLGSLFGKFFALEAPILQGLGDVLGATSAALGTGFISGAYIATLIGALAIVVALLWPAFNWTSARGRNRKVSALGAIVMIPFMVVSVLLDKMAQVATNFYGKSPHAPGMLSLAGSSKAKAARAQEFAETGKKPGSTLGKIAKTGVKVGAGVGLAVATGGAGSALAGTAVKGLFGQSMLGQAAGKVAFAGVDKAVGTFGASKMGGLIGAPLRKAGQLGGAVFDKTSWGQRLATTDENGNVISGSQVALNGFKAYEDYARRTNNLFYREDAHMNEQTGDEKKDLNGQKKDAQAPDKTAESQSAEPQTSQEQPTASADTQGQTDNGQTDKPQDREAAWQSVVASVPQFSDAHFDEAHIDRATIGENDATVEADHVETNADTAETNTESVESPTDAQSTYDERIDNVHLERPTLNEPEIQNASAPTVEAGAVDAEKVETEKVETENVDADRVETEKQEVVHEPVNGAQNPENPEIQAQNVDVTAQESTTEAQQADVTAQESTTETQESTTEAQQANVTAHESTTETQEFTAEAQQADVTTQETVVDSHDAPQPAAPAQTDWGNLGDELRANFKGQSLESESAPVDVNVPEPVETQPTEQAQPVVVSEPVDARSADSKPQEVSLSEPVDTRSADTEPQKAEIVTPVNIEKPEFPQQQNVAQPPIIIPPVAPQKPTEPAPVHKESGDSETQKSLEEQMLSALNKHSAQTKEKGEAKARQQAMWSALDQLLGAPKPVVQQQTTVNNVTRVAPAVAPAPTPAPNMSQYMTPGSSNDSALGDILTTLKENHAETMARQDAERKERLTDRHLAQKTFEKLPGQDRQSTGLDRSRLDGVNDQ